MKLSEFLGSMTQYDASVNTALCFLQLKSNHIKVYNQKPKFSGPGK